MTKNELEFIGVERVKEIHKLIWNGVISIIRDMEESEWDFSDVFSVVEAKHDTVMRMYEEGEISLHEYNALCDVGCHCALCLASEMLSDYRELPDNDDSSKCLFCKEAGITSYDDGSCLDGEYFRICVCRTKRVALSSAENIRDVVDCIEF